MKKFYIASVIPAIILLLLILPRKEQIEVAPIDYSQFDYIITEYDVEQPCKELETVESTSRTVTDYEYELLARVCMSEAGIDSFDGKVAVLETVLNRVDMGYGNIEEVVYAPNQYSTTDNGQPTEECYKAVDIALNNNIHPDNMVYFRTNYYHSFGVPYEQIGLHYFSLEGEE